MPQALNNFSACGAAETVARSFIMSNALAQGETLTGTPVCTISVLFGGVDLLPQNRLVGGPTINTVGVPGTQVGILFGGGSQVVGVTYQILITVMTSAGQNLECYASQLVLAA